MLKPRIQDDMKAALKAGEKRRLGAIRLILAAVKQKEVDERREMSDEDILVVLDKMIKQRRESIAQYEIAKRADLVEQENFELDIIKGYMPTALAQEDLEALISGAISAVGAQSMRDMSKVMAVLKPQVQGRADMAAVSARIKQWLTP
mgnify:CR=1 FL=1